MNRMSVKWWNKMWYSELLYLLWLNGIFFRGVGECINAPYRGDMWVPNPCVWGSVTPDFSLTMRSTTLKGEYPLNSHLHALQYLCAGSLFELLQREVPSSPMGFFLYFCLLYPMFCVRVSPPRCSSAFFSRSTFSTKKKSTHASQFSFFLIIMPTIVSGVKHPIVRSNSILLSDDLVHAKNVCSALSRAAVRNCVM